MTANTAQRPAGFAQHVTLPGDTGSENNARLARSSNNPPHPGESIDWSKKLYDSEGFEHSLVHLGGVQVVTQVSFAFAVWDRRTGVNTTNSESRISNRALTDLDRKANFDRAIDILRNVSEKEESWVEKIRSFFSKPIA